MVKTNNQEDGVHCTFCGRLVKSGKVNEDGMGATCARKHAQQQAQQAGEVGRTISEPIPQAGRVGENISEYIPLFEKEGFIPLDYSHFNTENQKILKVLYSEPQRKMLIHFTEDEKESTALLEIESEHSNEMRCVFNPDTRWQKEYKEQEIDEVVESYPFLQPIQMDLYSTLPFPVFMGIKEKLEKRRQESREFQKPVLDENGREVVDENGFEHHYCKNCGEEIGEEDGGFCNKDCYDEYQA